MTKMLSHLFTMNMTRILDDKLFEGVWHLSVVSRVRCPPGQAWGVEGSRLGG